MKSGTGLYFMPIRPLASTSSWSHVSVSGWKLIKNKLKLIIASEKFQHIIDIDFKLFSIIAINWLDGRRREIPRKLVN